MEQLKPLKNYSNLEKMLFDDLRINAEIFDKLSVDKIQKLSSLYHSTNVNLLAKYVGRNEKMKDNKRKNYFISAIICETLLLSSLL